MLPATRVVPQEDQRLARFDILEADAAQVRRIVPAGFVAIQRDGLIANDAGVAVGVGVQGLAFGDLVTVAFVAGLAGVV